jgi:HemY protein
MIRVVFFFVVVGALSLGVAWLADRPGDVVITWQGLRIETSLMVMGAALLAALVVLIFLWNVLRAIVRSPIIFGNLRRNRRGRRAYDAISNGLIAVGSGDVGAARKLAAEVNRIAAGEPLALLLTAQAAQLAGDRDAAERAFRAMASRADTKPLGLHGLFIEARRRNDLANARAYAEEAARTAPSLGWAGRAVLEFRCATGDWAGALLLLDHNKAMLDKAAYRRQRAVLLTARASAVDETDRDNAKAFALEAHKLAPDLVPAAALAGRLFAETGEERAASRIVNKTWRLNPHSELAQAYARLRSGDSARDRLKRIEALAKKVAGHVEGALATARAALDAQEFAKARAALAPYLAAPTKRIALLMAELERAEGNDEGRAREWLARALNAAPDPEWTADGYVSKTWLPVSPVTGRLDVFEWRVPLSGMLSAPSSTPLIEPEPPAAAPVTIAPEPAAVAPIEATPELQRDTKDPAVPTDATLSPGRGESQAKPQPKSQPIIPLVHAPDDPGPDIVEESDALAKPQAGGWRKLFE